VQHGESGGRGGGDEEGGIRCLYLALFEPSITRAVPIFARVLFPSAR